MKFPLEVIDYSKFDVGNLAREHGWDGTDLPSWCEERIAERVQERFGLESGKARVFAKSLPGRLTRHGGLPDIRNASSPIAATWAFAVTDASAFNQAAMEQWHLSIHPAPAAQSK